MNFRLFTIFMLSAIVFCNTLSANSITKVKFLSGASLATIKAKAREENKLIFIDFYANWCSPCNFMDETTFQDDRLSMYMDKNYIAYKVDVEDFEGYNLKQQFGVKTLPTFLIINAQGIVLGRFEESLSASRLLQELQKFNAPKPTLKKMEEVHNTGGTTNDYRRNTPNTPSALNAEKTVSVTKKTPSPAPKKVATPEDSTVSEPAEAGSDLPTNVAPKRIPQNMPTAFGDGLYEFNVRKHATKGFSVQTNAFAQLAFVLREVDKLQKAFPDETILVYISNQAGKPEPTYKIMVGAFDNERDADPIKTQLQALGISNPIVKNLATLK